MALTRRQREIYDFLRRFVAEHGYSPSLEEIGAAFGLSSVATVHKHVQHLVEKGYARKGWNRARSVEPLASAEAVAGGVVALPLLGTVAAGAPIEAIEVRETLEVPADLVPSGCDCFALRVRGDSMVDEQIRDGDCVVVEARAAARDGETVVALVGGQDATLKKLYRCGRRIRLQPANPRVAPIEVPAEEVEVRGVVRALLRRY